MRTYLDSAWRYVTTDTRQYYTSFSFVLFILALILPCDHILKTVLLLNSIMVGLLGNIIILYCFDRYRDQALEEDPTRTPKAVHAAILESNFVKHTLPMIVSAILLFACPMLTYKRVPQYYALLFSLVLLWSLLPFNGQMMKEKIEESYPGFKARDLMLLSLSVVGLAIWIAYLQRS
jgi:hypothetical protein